MIFRKLVKSDLELIIKSEKINRIQEPDVFSDFDENKYRKSFTSNIDSMTNNEVILCIEEDEIIARIDLIILNNFFDFSKEGYVDWVYVQKPHRRKGLARMLFAEAEKHFCENNVTNYYLFTASNDDAQAFYNSIDIALKKVEKGSKKI